MAPTSNSLPVDRVGQRNMWALCTPRGGGWGGKGGNPGPLPSCTAVWSSGTLGRGEPPRIPLSVWTEVVPHHPDGVCWIAFLFFLIIRSKRAGKELVPSLQQNS